MPTLPTRVTSKELHERRDADRPRHDDASALLNALLDRHEAARAPEILYEFASPTFLYEDAEKAFLALLQGAKAAGGVQLEMGRGEDAHLIDRVILRDGEALTRFLGRKPRDERVRGAVQDLRARLASLPAERQASAARELLAVGVSWKRGLPHRGLEPEQAEDAFDYLSAWAALATREPTDVRDLRTFSRQACGDSKLMERHLHRLLSAARKAGLVPEETKDDEEAKRLLGLEKFPHMACVGGTIPALGLAAERRVPMGLHRGRAAAPALPHAADGGELDLVLPPHRRGHGRGRGGDLHGRLA